MRVRLSLATGLIATLALLGACAQEPESYAIQDEAPPPAVQSEQVAPLAGGPSQDSQKASRQAADDAFVARMASKGLLAERRIDPDSGRTIWSISNRPVPNPVLFGGPTRQARAAPRARSRGTISSGVYAANSASSSSRTTAAASSASTTAADAAATSAAPSAQAAAETAAPTTAAAAPAAAGPGVRAIPQDTSNIPDPATAGFAMTPMMWGIVGLILLALLAALFLANRPKARRPAYHANQAPPEASGGDHEPRHA